MKKIAACMLMVGLASVLMSGCKTTGKASEQPSAKEQPKAEQPEVSEAPKDHPAH